ncbi:gluconate 2-dehydrogenase subunit 3 family protein [Mucilaginibacter psychrotolerans]|uniref:Gluconate 2-dehydrogenase subunit 3 family protein n=1 Tax=Mucilaginibacter psychrotolerans TaxID=1524096 RepID=A0A4Y8SLX4_9SPHI|nr:gluconate 2-dehydrogenase subunit 3 family protein [Mucilaginibacter psychrotolerans]TFF40079.1 gluconate 2-dehydrogenase subunit 3 family protein [Mucilaginibacter psychrotolerans]
MNRRDSLKALGLGTLSATVLLDACKTPDNNNAPATVADGAAATPGRQPAEVEREKKLLADKFFTDHEMATIAVLADIIIPKDDKSGSATDAKVPEFIEFIVKDIPEHQLPMRGGLRWLDVQCLNRFGKTFVASTSAQQIQLVDQIAYPAKAKPEMQQGVAFFNRMRDLTATGFFTTKMGIQDIGFAGNSPNKWEGVPADVLKQYGMENVVV